MNQLTEIRFNPIEFPQKDKPNLKGHELIIISSQIGYEVGMDGGARQVQETPVWRCMATPNATANAALTLLALLPPDLRRKVLETAEEIDNPTES
jgi:hypothetical protein